MIRTRIDLDETQTWRSLIRKTVGCNGVAYGSEGEEEEGKKGIMRGLEWGMVRRGGGKIWECRMWNKM